MAAARKQGEPPFHEHPRVGSEQTCPGDLFTGTVVGWFVGKKVGDLQGVARSIAALAVTHDLLRVGAMGKLYPVSGWQMMPSRLTEAELHKMRGS